MNTLEPHSDMWNERNVGVQLVADFPLVNMISQAVRDDVVGQELNVVLRAGLGSSTRIPGNTKDGRLSTKKGNKRSNSLSTLSLPLGTLTALAPSDQIRGAKFYHREHGECEMKTIEEEESP